MDPRLTKIRDFPAHSESITTVSVGKRNGELFATGSGDKKVNLWALENPNCLNSFYGHPTPISCVKISPLEDYVSAGSQSGHLKCWDLGSLKISRSLMGHRASVKAIEFSSAGSLLVSGSADGVIKLWDTRKKTAILSYKGHGSSGISSLAFSPTESSYASGGEDGVVKLWELRMSQMVQEFSNGRQQMSGVTCIAFHPSKLRLVAGHHGGELVFYDVDDKLSAAQSPHTSPNKFPGPTRCLLSVSESSVLAAQDDGLNICDWETQHCFETALVESPKIRDVAASADNLITVSAKRNVVSIYRGSLRTFQPFSEVGKADLTGVVDANSSATATGDEPIAPRTPRTFRVIKDSDNCVTNKGTPRMEEPQSPKMNPTARIDVADLVKISSARELDSSQSMELDPLSSLHSDHESIISRLQKRQSDLRSIYEKWHKREVKEAAELAVGSLDLTTTADFLSVMSSTRPAKWTLDTCLVVLPGVTKLFQSPSYCHKSAACDALRSLLKTFASTIRTNVASPMETIGVDLSQTDRFDKSQLCHQELVTIKGLLSEKPFPGNKLRNAIKEILGLLSGFD